jgi:hypothetical protein
VVVAAAPIWPWIAAPLALILALLVGLVLARRRRSGARPHRSPGLPTASR